MYSHSTEFSSLISIGLHEGDYVNDQYLSDFLGRSSGETGCSSHEETCKKLKNKLSKMFPNSDIRINDRIVLATDPVQLLFVKKDIRPDVFINCDHGKTFLQFEVHSTKSRATVFNIDDYRSTVRKLATGLAEQLSCLRQADMDTTEIVGYYLPTISFLHKPIQKIKCLWDEKKLRFKVTCEVLCSKRDAEDLKHVFIDQKRVFENITDQNRTNLPVLRLSKQFLERNFGRGAMQLCSGESFVIQANNLIYKLPFFQNEFRRLLFLKLMADRPSKSIFPCELKSIGSTGLTFFRI